MTGATLTPGVAAMLLFGVYNDRYRCIDEKWRFAQRRFSFMFQGALAPDAVTTLLPGDANAPFE